MQVGHHPVGHIRECPSTPPRLLYAESKKTLAIWETVVVWWLITTFLL